MSGPFTNGPGGLSLMEFKTNFETVMDLSQPLRSGHEARGWGKDGVPSAAKRKELGI